MAVGGGPARLARARLELRGMGGLNFVGTACYFAVNRTSRRVLT